MDVSPSLYEQLTRGWRAYALVALIALTSGLFGAGRMQVMDSDEARFAQATREIVETQTGDPREAQPGGARWVHAVVVSAALPITERTNAIWPYRLPSAIGLVLAALATMWGGAVLVGQRAAFFGASLFAAGMLAGFEGMTASATMIAIACTTLAMAALAHLHANAQSPKATSVVFWIALTGAIAAGGLHMVVLVALTVATLMLWERRALWLLRLMWWPGPLLALLAFGSALLSGGVELNAASFELGGDGRFALPGYHLFLLPFFIFPATYALPAAGRLAFAAVRAPRADEQQAAVRFLLCWIVPAFLLFELIPSKLPHNVLPLYPAIALLCGAGLMEMRRWRTAHPAGVVMYAVSGIVIAALLAIAATFMPGDFGTDLRRAVSSALIGIGVVAFAFAGLMVLRRPEARAAVLVLSALLLAFSLRERLLPEARSINVSSEAVAALTRARLTPNDERQLWAVGYREMSLVFLTRTEIRQATPSETGAGAHAGDALLIEGRVLEETEAALALQGLAFAPREEPVSGFSLGGGDQVRLFVGEAVLSADAAAAPQ